MGEGSRELEPQPPEYEAGMPATLSWQPLLGDNIAETKQIKYKTVETEPIVN
jgi:hypothetical protein